MVDEEGSMVAVEAVEADIGEETAGAEAGRDRLQEEGIQARDGRARRIGELCQRPSCKAYARSMNESRTCAFYPKIVR